MTARDRVVRWVLGGGVVLAVVTELVAGPWIPLVVVLVTLAAAAVVYRIEPSRIDLEDQAVWGHSAEDRERAERVDQ